MFLCLKIHFPHQVKQRPTAIIRGMAPIQMYLHAYLWLCSSPTPEPTLLLLKVEWAVPGWDMEGCPRAHGATRSTWAIVLVHRFDLSFEGTFWKGIGICKPDGAKGFLKSQKLVISTPNGPCCISSCFLTLKGTSGKLMKHLMEILSLPSTLSSVIGTTNRWGWGGERVCQWAGSSAEMQWY